MEDDPASAGLRRQLAELELRLEEERVVNELGRGNHNGVIGDLEVLVGKDPTREQTWCLLVAALAGSGRQADALDAVARARRALAVELGIEPGPHLRELERAILTQQEVSISGSPPPVPHRGSSVSPKDRLPSWDTRFCGRRPTSCCGWSIEFPRTRVLVLTGPGGIGKTRLAASVAGQLTKSFADGVYFVGLAGIVADATDYAIAEGAGVRREPQRTPLESLIAWLGGRDVLLVLDNCEEVVEPVRRALSRSWSTSAEGYECSSRAAARLVSAARYAYPCDRWISQRHLNCSPTV